MYDVAVAGGGLIGLAVAWRAAQRGLSVTVADDALGAGASFAAAGMLAPVSEAAYGEERLLELCRASLERFPAFAAEVEQAAGVDVGLRTAGTLAVGFDDDDMAAVDALHVFHRELGLAAERLTSRESRRREPALTPRVRGGLYVAGDHSVDARALHAGLLAAAQSAGVRVVPARVASVWASGGRACGVRLAGGGEVAAGTVVLARGAWSATLPGVRRCRCGRSRDRSCGCGARPACSAAPSGRSSAADRSTWCRTRRMA